jgi:predicted TIM-barrel fold metal-dependent hydrolase
MIHCTILFLAGVMAPIYSHPLDDIKELKLKDWQPRSMMVTKVTRVEKPAFPVIDVHNHLGGVKNVEQCLAEMDEAGVECVVNLDGGWGERLKRELARFDEAHPGRFLTYALIDFKGVDDDDWSDRVAAQLERDFEAGAKGLKFHKSLGLSVRYKNGALMRIDDPKLDPVWEMCAKYKRPVEIHTADPAAFFTPLDRFNERWHELNDHLDWLFHGKDYPSRNELLQQRNNVIAKHPDALFIGAHVGNNPENLAAVAKWLDSYPNFHIDIDARISELGRQPYTTRRFLIQYQDRVMFGTDTRPDRNAYRMYYRFLETDDEYFDPSEGHHPQGFWRIYGVFLPPDVLKKLYRENAKKILVGLQ